MSSSPPTRDSAAIASEVSLDRKTWARFIGAVRAVATSELQEGGAWRWRQVKANLR
jgi:hypothetical protein